MSLYVDYRLGNAPSWMLGAKYRVNWNVGFGQIEDAFFLQTKQLVEARFPDYAPMDDGGMTSLAMQYIGQDRQLLYTFGDDATLDVTRAYFKQGFTQGSGGFLSPVSGATLAWQPGMIVSPGVKIGVSDVGFDASFNLVYGRVFTCIQGGVTGSQYPGFQFSQVGQVVPDQHALQISPGSGSSGFTIQAQQSGVLWQWDGTLISDFGSALPVNPQIPGWYYAGTDTGLIQALINSGFYTYDSDGNFVPPRIYHNRDFVTGSNLSHTAFGMTVELTGALSVSIDYLVSVLSAGVPNVSGSVLIYDNANDINWGSGQTIVSGNTRKDPLHTSNRFIALTSGITGATNPFPSSPSNSSYPPTPSQIFDDGGVQWAYAVFAPIPATMRVGVGWGLSFTNPASGAFSYFLTATPSPPDGRADAWSRIWVVVPLNNFGTPLLWGDGPGGFNGYWGAGPNDPSHTTPPVPWGAGTNQTNSNTFGVLTTIANRWVAGSARLIGFWGTFSGSNTIDAIPLPVWHEEWSITIGGQSPAFFRTNTELT